MSQFMVGSQLCIVEYPGLKAQVHTTTARVYLVSIVFNRRLSCQAQRPDVRCRSLHLPRPEGQDVQ